MTVRVRFAPSPTGYLHIGGARTALYNYFYAKKMQGTLVLRIEDTDLERSSREFETAQIQDLKWLGLQHDEGPDVGGPYGPYRQSERLDIYHRYAQQLIAEGKAYYCFCTDEELEQMKQKAMSEGRLPHYEGKWRNPQWYAQASERVALGEKASIRFKVPLKSYVLQDIVRDRVVYPQEMVGDFVLIRSNGLPVYNYCCVVDDIEMKITHVIRGEDHLSNTVRQLMIYEALNAQVPAFAHLSLLIGKDRQKLSKRHGATSVNFYRELGYLPTAVINYLCLLGWSHPGDKDIFTPEDLCQVFTLDRLSKASAIYDPDKFLWVNGQHLRFLPLSEFQEQVESQLDPQHPYFQFEVSHRLKVLSYFQHHLQLSSEFADKVNEEIFRTAPVESDVLREILQREVTQRIQQFLKDYLEQFKDSFLIADQFAQLMDAVKTQCAVKGKDLFMGVRVLLTGRDHGAELKDLIPLTPLKILKQRLADLTF